MSTNSSNLVWLTATSKTIPLYIGKKCDENTESGTFRIAQKSKAVKGRQLSFGKPMYLSTFEPNLLLDVLKIKICQSFSNSAVNTKSIVVSRQQQPQPAPSFSRKERRGSVKSDVLPRFKMRAGSMEENCNVGYLILRSSYWDTYLWWAMSDSLANNVALMTFMRPSNLAQI